jgi:hypothetical protein
MTRARVTMKIRSKQFISSQTFPRTSGERVQETTVEERFKSQILDSFDPVTQKLYQLLHARIHNNPTIQKSEKIEVTLSSRANAKKILSPTRGTTVAVLGHCARSKLPQLVGIEANTRKQSLE